MRERVADHFGLLVDLLRHEVAIAALVHQRRPSALRDLDLAVGGRALGIVDRDLRAAQHRHIAVFQIGDAVGERREREGVGAEIGFLLAIADRERAAFARADQKVIVPLKIIASA